MESSKVFIEESSIKVVNEEEIKKKIIEDYLNYREISEAITKGNSTINFIFEEEQNMNKYWEIQTSNGTKEDGIILLKSSLGEIYINRDQKKGKIQYLNMKENKENLVDEEKLIEKELAEEMQESEQERNEDIEELTVRIENMDKNIRDLINLMNKMITLLELKNKEDNGRKNNRRRYNEKNCYHCEKIGHIRPNGPENRRIM